MLICPRCGKTSDEKEFVEAFCIDCYEFNIKLPKGLTVQQCKHCNRMNLQGQWQQLNRRKISEYVAGKCKGDFTGADCDIDTGVCSFTFERAGKKVTVQRQVDLQKEVTMCPDCSRASGGYYEAIVQLRGEPSRVEEQAMRLEKRLSKKTFVSKIEEMHGGLDLYVGSSKAATSVLHELGFKPSVARKLFGRRDGKKLYRMSYAIRV
jgi:nonsense-mediated mRNA decay protein 3